MQLFLLLEHLSTLKTFFGWIETKRNDFRLIIRVDQETEIFYYQKAQVR